MIRALIFDFDGVILDTETPDFVSCREVFVDHGAELSLEVFAQAIGTGPGALDVYAHLGSLAARTIDVDSVRFSRRARHEALIAVEVIMPGVEAWLAEARRLGLKLGIASSSTNDWVEGHLERLGLGSAFDCIRCRDDRTPAKPAPDLYLGACEALGVAPSEALAVEDSPNGIAAAKAAGLLCLAVPNSLTAALDLSRADFYLDSLAGGTLEDLIANLV